jgi:hypothetical protein
MLRLTFAALAALSTAATAAPLTIHTGETWIFTIAEGQPANAHKTKATAKPGKGELMASARALLGTQLIVTNNTRTAYTYSAELLSGGKALAARACTLPAGGQPTLEHWSEKAEAVRIGNFRATGTEGRC